MRTKTMAIVTALLATTIVTPMIAAGADHEPASEETKANGRAVSSSETRPQTNLRRYVPSTVSEGWRQVFAILPDPTTIPPMPGPDDIEGWAKVHEAFEKGVLMIGEEAVKQYQARVVSRNLGGVAVLEVIPRDWVDNGKLLVYTHGGAYTLFSARSSLLSAALVANRTGMRVISVDYMPAPRARWQEICEQVVTAFEALNQEGHPMSDLAIFGDSAGGGLAAGVVLKLRDAGLGMPAAVVLWSPWTDITETGDTYVTLKDSEPCYLYKTLLGPSADAYADRKDQKRPYVSPVYGDFAKGFPPTLIQGGTREILLSGFVRLYQALDTAGQTVKLDIYEGMPHVFQIRLPDSPESVTALDKTNAFLVKYLTL